MTITVPVTAQTVQVFGDYATAQTVVNTGQRTAYLDSQTGVGVSGLPLAPGSNVVWDAHRPLFVACAVGDATTLVVTDNSGPIFNPAAIASQIISQGLAGQISASIFASGIPTVDSPTSLFQVSGWGSLATSTGATILSSATYGTYVDCSKQQNVTLSVTVPSASSSIVPTGYWRLDVYWKTKTISTVTRQETFFLKDATQLAIQIPCKGELVGMYLINMSGDPRTIDRIVCMGSQRLVADPDFFPDIYTAQDGWIGSASSGFVATADTVMPVASAAWLLIPCRRGLTHWSFLFSAPLSSGGMVQVTPLAVYGHGYSIQILIPPGSTAFEADVALPDHPCLIYVGGAPAIDAGTFLSITWTSKN